MFQGGASLQFSAVCYNLLQDGERQTANYLTTRTWPAAFSKGNWWNSKP